MNKLPSSGTNKLGPDQRQPKPKVVGFGDIAIGEIDGKRDVLLTDQTS